MRRVCWPLSSHPDERFPLLRPNQAPVRDKPIRDNVYSGERAIIFTWMLYEGPEAELLERPVLAAPVPK